MRGLPEQFQHGTGTAQAGLKQFAFDLHHAAVAQGVPMRHVPRPRHDQQLGKVLAGQVHNFERLLDIVDGHHQNARRGSACRAQQIQSCRVAVEHAVAKCAYRLDHFGIVVQHGGCNPLRQQHAANDLAIAAKAGDDDWRRLRLGNFRHGVRAAPGIARQQQPVHSDQQQRRDQHRQGHRAYQQRSGLGTENLGASCCLKHHKGEFAALCEQHSEHRPLLKGQLHKAGQGVNDREFQPQKAEDDSRHQRWRPEQDTKVDTHPHGDKKQAQQQTLERLDVGFQFAPVFAFGQQHAGQKSAQGHRQANGLHQRSNADNQQQRGCGKNFRCATVGNPAQQRSQKQSATQNDATDSRYYFYSFKRPI